MPRNAESAGKGSSRSSSVRPTLSRCATVVAVEPPAESPPGGGAWAFDSAVRPSPSTATRRKQWRDFTLPCGRGTSESYRTRPAPARVRAAHSPRPAPSAPSRRIDDFELVDLEVPDALRVRTAGRAAHGDLEAVEHAQVVAGAAQLEQHLAALLERDPRRTEERLVVAHPARLEVAERVLADRRRQRRRLARRRLLLEEAPRRECALLAGELRDEPVELRPRAAVLGHLGGEC